MTRPGSLTCTVVLCVLLPCLRVAAQDAAAADPPAHISLVDGAAVLERDGRSDPATGSMPLLAGDRLRTQTGRIEVLYADGSSLHLDANTVVDFQSDEVIRLLDGRVRVNIVGPNRQIAYRIDAPSAWVQIEQPGEYRVALVRGPREAEVELAVLRGSAELANEEGRTLLRAGERAYAGANAAPSTAYVFNSAAWDSFDRWSEARRDQRLGVSTQYLPNEVRPYAATFDQYGSWRYAADYGYVWYPTVSVGWRPYYHGRWASLRPFGWTWIGADPWGWPTHHYGRWGFSAGVWFWIPGRQWGPAWVSWAYAPGFVSWCPLGWNNRPVVQLLNVNVYGGSRYDPWRAWTVVPHQRFGTGFVNVNVIGGAAIGSRIRGGFVERTSGPDYRGYAVPRSTVPIRALGGRSVVAPSAETGTRAGSIQRQSGTPGDPRAGDRAATDAFLSRRSQSRQGTDAGYPSPSRVPRGYAVPSDPSARSATGSAVNGRELSSPESADRGVRSGRQRTEGFGSSPSPESAPADRRAVPVYRGGSAPGYGAPSAIRPSGEPARDLYQAPPGTYRGDYRARPGADSPNYGPARAPESGSPYGGRAVPRSGSESGPPPSARQQPGPERAAPAPSQAGPPPSAAPSRSTPRPAPSAGEGRSGGGQRTGGTAVRRSGGRGGV